MPPQGKKRRRSPQVNMSTEEEMIMKIIDSSGLVNYLLEKKLLPMHLLCTCGNNMTQQASAEQTDGFLFKCSRCRRKKCQRKGSMFEGSRLTLAKIMKIVYRYVEGVRVKRCAALVVVHRNTAMHWYAICRNVSTNALMSAVGQIGGKDIEVQVDETMVARRNNNKGRKGRQYWVVGMYDTSIRKAVFEHVNNLSWPALKTVITKWVAKESVVVTDEWKAYRKTSLITCRNLLRFKKIRKLIGATKVTDKMRGAGLLKDGEKRGGKTNKATHTDRQ
ncbi:unnamed protein product [Schistocephalus solidus]|uniref:DDE_Tnp_IS1595 domain-containing protein n=1 Tax=Schistocephalus solidus TaxID=70667 RepID=A0A183SQC2_SCHSO|nr:unnamed protein product [Schistocephalus solidus]